MKNAFFLNVRKRNFPSTKFISYIKELKNVTFLTFIVHFFIFLSHFYIGIDKIR